MRTVACLLLLGLAAPLAGQEQAAPAWWLSVNAGATWDSNPYFTTPPRAAGPVSRLGIQFRRGFAGPRHSLAVSGDAATAFNHASRDLDQRNVGAGVSGEFRLSARSRLSLGDTYSRSYTSDSAFLLESGLLLPLDVVQTNTLTARFGLQLADGASLSADLYHRVARFQSSRLVDGSDLDGGVSLTRRHGPRETWGIALRSGLSLVARDRDSLGRAATASATWTRTLSARRSVSLTGGVTYVPGASGSPAANARRFWPSGSGELSWAFQRGGLAVRYGRTWGQAFGLGRDRILDAALFSGRRSLSRRMQFNASMGYAQSHDPADTASQYASTSLAAGVRFSASRSLALETGYSLLRGEPDGSPGMVTRHIWSASLAGGWSRR